jgi:chorismate-pyruvate lyase
VQQLTDITAPFFPTLAELGEFTAVASAALPADYQTLLDHDDHMTVTVEAYHGSLVDVRVLAEHRVGDLYSRCSLLVCQSSGEVAQIGIMRINLAGLAPRVREDVESKRAPLGRVLIRHNVLRRVKLHELWQIVPGPALRDRLALSDRQQTTFGRSAGIIVDGKPAVELLEIVKA